MKRLSFAFAFALAAFAASARPGKLLSGNARGEAFAADVQRLETGATLAWVEEGEFATDANVIKTQRDGAGRQRVLNGRLGGDGEAAVWGSWGGKKPAAAVFDLQMPHLVRGATVWSAEKPGTWGMAEFSVALSDDGREWFEAGVFRVPPAHEGASGKAPAPEPFRLDLEKPAAARYVRVCARKNPNRHQMVLGEIAVWGDVAHGDKIALPSEARPGVHPRLCGIGSAALAIDWRDYAISGAEGFRVYASDTPFSDVRDEGVELLAAMNASAKRFVICPLRPRATRHYAVAPLFADGEMATVESVPYAPPAPLDRPTLGSMLGINHFYDGGGASEGPLPTYWKDVVLDILAKTPFQSIRWWRHPESIVRKYHDRGIEATSWANDIAAARELGVRLLDFGNEPHLQGIEPEAFARKCLDSRAQCEKEGATAAAGFAFYGPTIGIDEHSVEYLDRFLAAGGGDACDAFDFHDYVGPTADFVQPPGYPAGAPEAIPARIAKIRAVIAKHGQEGKPLMCSEWGYSDCRVHNAHGDITPLRKAQFLVRGSILHFALGFRRLFLYSFYDEGTDPGNPEHFFGLVSRDLQKKTAFYAMQTLGEVLGDAAPAGAADGTGNGVGDGGNCGDYGYVFQTSGTNDFASVFWNGAFERAGLFRTTPGEVEIVTMLGERRRVRTAADGTFRARFGASPVYFRAAAPVALVEAANVEGQLREGCASARPQTGGTPVSPVISLSSADGGVAVLAAGGKQRLAFTIGNASDDTIVARLTLRDFGGGSVAEARAECPPRQKTEIFFDVDPASFRLQRYTLAADYETGGESLREECSAWLRVVGGPTGGATRIGAVRFANLDEPILALESDELEATVLTRHGGAVLEIIDKRTLRNQLALDYADLPRLASVPFANGMFDTMRIRGANARAAYGRNTPFEFAADGDAVRLTADLGGGVSAAKTLRLDGDRLFWETSVSNGTQQSVMVDWHLHPEFVPGGTADSYADVLVVPKADGPFELPFWSGLGERRIGDASEGWWELRDTAAGYAIRSEYDRSAIGTLRVWFGAAAMNIELLALGRQLSTGEIATFQTRWILQRSNKQTRNMESQMRRPPPIDIRSFGALESAAPSVNAAAIETALHAAAANGGGTVVVPPGIWNTGTIRLRSHVELHLPIPTLSET